MIARTIVFLAVCNLLRLVRLGSSPDGKDVEIALLRPQLTVLHRQVARPRYTPTDRLILATLSRLLPRPRWSAFLVTPATVLRWHRELVRRRWTYPSPSRRRGLDAPTIELVLDWQRRTRVMWTWELCGVGFQNSATSPDLGF